MIATANSVRCSAHTGEAHPPRCDACETAAANAAEVAELERLRLTVPDPGCTVQTPCDRCIRERELRP